MAYKPKREYVIYKGDEVICGGTAKEVMEKLNIKSSTFRRMQVGYQNEKKAHNLKSWLPKA